MTKQEFNRIVNESVAAGASRAEAEDYVIRGFKIAGDVAKTLRSVKSVVAGVKAAVKRPKKKAPMKR